MSTMKIDCAGLTYKEVQQLAEDLRGIEGVDSVRIPWNTHDGVPVGTLGRQTLSIQASVGPAMHLLVTLTIKAAEGAGVGIGAVTAHALYKKVGNAIADKTWDWVKAKFSGESVIEVGVQLYGPDDKLIKKIDGRR